MGMMFGEDENIDCIVDVQLKGAKDEALCLAHKHTKIFVVAGVWVNDDGYVLGVKSDSKKYYDMPAGETLATMQQNGLLPKPLPPYSLSFFDYLFGYSLWIIVGVMVLWAAGKALLRRGGPAPLQATGSIDGDGPPMGAPTPQDQSAVQPEAQSEAQPQESEAQPEPEAQPVPAPSVEHAPDPLADALAPADKPEPLED